MIRNKCIFSVVQKESAGEEERRKRDKVLLGSLGFYLRRLSCSAERSNKSGYY